MRCKLPLTALCIAAIAAAGGAAQAQQDDANFYRGKTIQLYVGTSAGGAYDLAARTVSRHLGKHVPGTPIVTVQNMPGAGGLTLMNLIYNTAPRDGTVLALVNNGIPSAPYLTPNVARFDPVRLSWLGSSSRESQVVAFSGNAGFRTIEDLRQKESVVGAVGPGTATTDFPMFANAIVGTKFKVVNGYKGVPSIVLALQRGEVQGNASLGWNYAKSQLADSLKDGSLRLIAQYGFEPHPDLLDLPLMPTGDNEIDRKASALLYSRLDYGRPFFGPPGIPPARLATLRRAFMATLEDPEFRKEAAQAQIDIDPVSGEQLAKLTQTIGQTTPEVAARVRDSIGAAAK